MKLVYETLSDSDRYQFVVCTVKYYTVSLQYAGKLFVIFNFVIHHLFISYAIPASVAQSVECPLRDR